MDLEKAPGRNTCQKPKYGTAHAHLKNDKPKNIRSLFRVPAHMWFRQYQAIKTSLLAFFREHKNNFDAILFVYNHCWNTNKKL